MVLAALEYATNASTVQQACSEDLLLMWASTEPLETFGDGAERLSFVNGGKQVMYPSMLEFYAAQQRCTTWYASD